MRHICLPREQQRMASPSTNSKAMLVVLGNGFQVAVHARMRDALQAPRSRRSRSSITRLRSRAMLVAASSRLTQRHNQCHVLRPAPTAPFLMAQ